MILIRSELGRIVAFFIRINEQRTVGRQMPDLKAAIARFGADAKAKLANPSATGEPEDQLRAPLEALFACQAAGKQSCNDVAETTTPRDARGMAKTL